jgi:hypothetical protein
MTLFAIDWREAVLKFDLSLHQLLICSQELKTPRLD